MAKAPNADKLDGHDSEHFATAADSIQGAGSATGGSIVVPRGEYGTIGEWTSDYHVEYRCPSSDVSNGMVVIANNSGEDRDVVVDAGDACSPGSQRRSSVAVDVLDHG